MDCRPMGFGVVVGSPHLLPECFDLASAPAGKVEHFGIFRCDTTTGNGAAIWASFGTVNWSKEHGS
jgi:hypothetical protein